jgi:hypothetical protein
MSSVGFESEYDGMLICNGFYNFRIQILFK